MTQIAKDPAAILDYGFRWTKWLPTGVTIESYSFPDLPAGLTIVDDDESDGLIIFRLSGAADGQSYVVTNEVVLSDGQVDRRRMIIVGRNRFRE